MSSDSAKLVERFAAVLEKTAHPTSLEFYSLLVECAELHHAKQQDYGTDADPFANIRASEDWGIPAWKGALMRGGGDKVSRLKTYARTGQLACEGVEDSMKDLAVYALIALVLHRNTDHGSGAA